MIDTGIFVSALITQGTPPDLLYKLARYLNQKETATLLNLINTYADVVINLPEVNYSPDTKDNGIIATAIKGKANYLVTGDKRDLLALKQVQEIQIVTAREMLNIININEK